ncbi:diacylglycerol/lipid kinase family protein [Halovivax limisalsi]|uniref:diacylglycerol/lipid kinase family protein n=1 Tax=Halovivax limisalsi TaxID=1453760 RepID=UPI001FFD2323|nr:YegS/Rv2252/BmrU family lipid kinase [Halovivax limisalsi]
MASSSPGRGVVVVNPVSGSADHVDTVVERAADAGFETRLTDAAGDARRIAREVAPAAEVVVAAGGDGTVNEVVNGIVEATATESTTLGIVPAGTGNNFATNVGIEGIEAAFDVLARDRRREIDLGLANDRAFVNSCVGGITAAASAATGSEEKASLGVLAYVRNTIEEVTSYDAPPLSVDLRDGSADDVDWQGDALFVFVGNARRFSGTRTAQADVEDGLFEVVVVGEEPPSSLVGDAALERLLGRDGDAIVRRRTPSVRIACEERSVEYSLDGEMLETDRLELDVAAASLSVIVGEGYAADPDGRRT